jgi:nucleotide-binding universal stress UspA family protein
MFKNILLAVDGSEHSMRAAQVAAEVAGCAPATLRVLVAYDRIPPDLGDPFLERVVSERTREAEKILQKTLPIIGTLPGEVHTEILEGPVAEAILRVAETRQNDLIVMGSRGLGTLAGILLGSQSQKVLNHAPCPVLIVR